jgi:hypothetical protein
MTYRNCNTQRGPREVLWLMSSPLAVALRCCKSLRLRRDPTLLWWSGILVGLYHLRYLNHNPW